MVTARAWLAASLLAVAGCALSACGGGGGGGGGTGSPPAPPPSTNANLQSLSLSGLALTTSFQPAQTSYLARATFLTPRTTLTATTEDAGARLSIDGGAVVGGTASATVQLAEGSNTLSVTVTAADGMTRRTYQVVVERQAAAAFAQQAYVKASNADKGMRNPLPNPAQFGSAVALSGNTMAIGAPSDLGAGAGIGADPSRPGTTDSGAVYVFVRTASGSWDLQTYIKPSTASVERFGTVLALQADTLVVGAPANSSGASGVGAARDGAGAPSSGAVHVFVRGVNGSWTEQAFIKASNAGAGDEFGSAVSLSGDSLLVGAPGEDSDAAGIGGNQASDVAQQSGAAYLFVRSGTSWTQQAYLKASNPGGAAQSIGAGGDQFGAAVAIQGDLAVVGAPYEDSDAVRVDGAQGDANAGENSGAVYVFARSGGSWSQSAYYKASNTGRFDEFGSAVAISAPYIIVGAPGEASSGRGINAPQLDDAAPSSGAVYMFIRGIVPGPGGQIAYIKSSNSDPGDRFGSSVAMDAGLLVVGAPNEDGAGFGVSGDAASNRSAEAGAAYVFPDAAAIFFQQAYLKPSLSQPTFPDAGFPTALFGRSVAVSDGYVAVGGPGESGQPVGYRSTPTYTRVDGAGAVQTFERVSGAWQVRPLVRVPNAVFPVYRGPAARFGLDVAISGDTMVVGAPYEDSDARGVDGDQNNAAALDSGAAFVFVRSAGRWTQQAYLKASNTGGNPAFGSISSGANFGSAVAIDGDTIVVGAPGEFGRGVGIDGDQSPYTNGSGRLGAAYVFVRQSGRWTQQAYIRGGPDDEGTFGLAVQISGDLLAVSSLGTSVNLYTRRNGAWSNEARLVPDTFNSRRTYGATLALTSDTLAVGVPESPASGDGREVYVYARGNGGWVKQAYLVPDPGQTPITGYAVGLALSGDTLVIGTAGRPYGSTQCDSMGFAAGTVYVYGRTGGAWIRQPNIEAPGPQLNACFGVSVALAGDILVVGASGESRGGRGTGGDFSIADASQPNSGAAYVYLRDATGWKLKQYLKPSNTRLESRFGYSVALDGDTVVVGSPLEWSSASGVDADQSNVSTFGTGAVYVFR